MKKEYLYLGLFAAVFITISYFVIFPKTTADNGDFSGENSSEQSSESSKEGKGKEGSYSTEGRIYYPDSSKNKFSDNKFNSGSMEKKEFKSGQAKKAEFGKTDLKGGGPEGTAGNIKTDVGTKLSASGNLSGRVFLEESLFHEGTTVILKKDKEEFKVKTGEKGEGIKLRVTVGNTQATVRYLHTMPELN